MNVGDCPVCTWQSNRLLSYISAVPVCLCVVHRDNICAILREFIDHI